MIGGYNQKIIEHFKNPHNVGEIPDADVKATEGSPACGDQVTLFLKVDPAEKRITDIKFQSYGCASNIATGSIITDIAMGKTLEEAKKISWKDADQELGGLPKVKVHCAVLAVDALHTAIEKYEIQHGLVEKTIPTTADTLRKRLRHVINPIAGLDIVSTNLLKDARVEGQTAVIVLNLDERHQFANNIKNEIIERLEILWDIKTIDVRFEG
jgi:nitrogen fixation protein NifU and related proteins